MSKITNILLAASAAFATLAANVSLAEVTTAHANSYIATEDGVQLYYKDWGSGQPIVFSHGWPLNADSWESQMYHLAANGCRKPRRHCYHKFLPVLAVVTTTWTPQPPIFWETCRPPTTNISATTSLCNCVSLL